MEKYLEGTRTLPLSINYAIIMFFVGLVTQPQYGHSIQPKCSRVWPNQIKLTKRQMADFLLGVLQCPTGCTRRGKSHGFQAACHIKNKSRWTIIAPTLMANNCSIVTYDPMSYLLGVLLGKDSDVIGLRVQLADYKIDTQRTLTVHTGRKTN